MGLNKHFSDWFSGGGGAFLKIREESKKLLFMWIIFIHVYHFQIETEKDKIFIQFKNNSKLIMHVNMNNIL